MEGEGGSGDACYYSVLGIRKDASFSDVRAAYRKLAMQWHPDRCEKNGLSAVEAKERFQKIQEAYSVLSDETKRAMYNAGMLDLYVDEDDEGMKDFMRELFTMAENYRNDNLNAQESFEDLQKTFMELFGDDLAKMAGKDNCSSNHGCHVDESRRVDRPPASRLVD
ncbi:hypothetical protein DCAR_0933821 [Daucus carota subsp. sativus]|uniref:J domain-containing protein n=1 Tax=Daucus carota subsp. sativus TaxID=79200 RepID=A0AAF1BEP3_DAUCS|nr:hypothetical protein DCAR_0933821 [Daucus carota subsp. sativus]